MINSVISTGYISIINVTLARARGTVEQFKIKQKQISLMMKESSLPL